MSSVRPPGQEQRQGGEGLIEHLPCAMFLPAAMTGAFEAVPVNSLTDYLAAAAVGLDGVESPTQDDGDVADLPDDVPMQRALPRRRKSLRCARHRKVSILHGGNCLRLLGPTL